MIDFLLVLLAPIAALAFLPLKKRNRNVFYCISVTLSLISLYASFSIDVHWKFAIDEVGFSLMVDKYSKIFLMLLSCTWLISIIYSFEFTRYNFQEKKTEFFLYLNILLSVVVLNACAGNLITLFFFYTIGIPITYPLLKLRENSEALKAARGFLLQTLLPSLLIFLPAIVGTYYLTGNIFFDHAATFQSSHVDTTIGGILLAMFVIGISKNSVFPFHLWLPNTNPAPAPVSGLIHSVANVKTGVIALIKIAIYIFGLDYVHLLTSSFFTGGWLTYLCGLTAVYTAYRALFTDDLKQRFAFSTVGQLSYMILAILIGSTTGVQAAMLHVVTHAIAKSCLFYVAGFYNSIYHTVSAKKVGKIMPHTKFVALVIAVCGLSITGFPFLAGYYSKDLMLIEEWHSQYYASAIFLVIGSFINILYIIGPVRGAFKKKEVAIESKAIPISMLVTFIISVLLIIGSNLYIPLITDMIK